MEGELRNLDVDVKILVWVEVFSGRLRSGCDGLRGNVTQFVKISGLTDFDWGYRGRSGVGRWMVGRN